ncbi:DUF262 domain-containing protein [Gluconobacter albidus]|uniref:DUF262 domain-containing protein n=1 Tax=Gluconobacter albidus TaxID=318683 RepID=UPI0030AE31BC
MSLSDEIKTARKQVVTDGYEMSVGEIINLYKENELIIDPVFQRLFRWDDERKTRFIESIILGIPIPPIFVFQNENGVWELIDGLQRISTILQLTGDLKGERADELGPLVLNGTRFLPSLDGKKWSDSKHNAKDGIGQALQIEIKRARVRVEILKSESDTSAKFELFQRLNTGGSSLTPQEVRNSITVSLNPKFYKWLVEHSENRHFVKTTGQTTVSLDAQAGVELALRFFAFRAVPYTAGLDVHEYLDDAVIKMAQNQNYKMQEEGSIFNDTFKYIDEALGTSAFKRWDGKRFSGKFLMSVFEVIATGVSKNIVEIKSLKEEKRSDFIKTAAKNLWSDEKFTRYSGAGVRGTTRLSRLLPLAETFLKP